jgi:hypothetical protein
MAVLDDIAAQRQRVAERLARVDAERAKLAEQLASWKLRNGCFRAS